jgi:pimeloyl-ACP methyl ester carboxylesterase
MEPVRIAYRDTRGSTPGVAPVVLLHGSPGTGDVFDQLTPYLGARRALVPDLPGFGASSHRIPDYSIAAHAAYVERWLDRLGVPQVHLVGFSMGGGVALHVADAMPARIASLTMLSAIGVQEMELLGEYHLNHAVHGVQLAAVWALATLLPHRGALDAPYPYARNFYDSDQRPLRGILERLPMPVLIVHGRRDPLVPFEAALEHARLVPQSELRAFDQDHFMLFQATAVVGPPIAAFLDRVDRGLAVRRTTAPPVRVRAAAAPFDPARASRVGGLHAVARLSSVVWSSFMGGWSRTASMGALVAVAYVFTSTVASHRRRRLLVSSWRRATRWEYWPPWLFYPPVVAWIAWLAVKHRSATLFTAANPAIPDGGFVGESKFAILEGLAGAGAFVARSGLIAAAQPAEARIAEAREFLATRRLRLPVVLKPNEGERGTGVAVVRTDAELVSYLEQATGDTVIQEFVPGVEFGVFYVRHPSAPCGFILSITEKHLPAVQGDGRRTLEQLILDDQRAVGMARFHLRHQAAGLALVPGAGERVSLGDCGSHCRGALFLDGRRFATPALEASVERVARTFDGFHFGRFDVRSPSAEAFARGEFRVLELNGVTSEAAHIYDPANSLFAAYRALFEQWSLAFAIGGENARRGTPVTSPLALLRLTVRSWRKDAEDGH